MSKKITTTTNKFKYLEFEEYMSNEFHELNTNPTYLLNRSIMSTQIWHEPIKP